MSVYQIVRETAIQGLVAISALPYARIYPYRPQVGLLSFLGIDYMKKSLWQWFKGKIELLDRKLKRKIGLDLKIWLAGCSSQ
ncbi:hypothetical protein BHE74_00008938, partial [Ensete ventricosum]